MLESQIALREATSPAFEKYLELMPHLKGPYRQLADEAYKEGAVSAKHKRLMALVGALVSGCRACILFQAEKAMDQGASVEEILEACGVAISLGGTMAAGETTRLMQYLSELEKI